MITPVDIKYVLDELNILEGSTIETIFRKGRKILIKTKDNDVLISPDTLYLTTTSKIREIDEFAITLRKFLKNKTIESIEQYGFDKLVIMSFEDKVLILEFFDGGNCVLCDKSYKIIMPLEFKRINGRNVIAKEDYPFPGIVDLRYITGLKRILSKGDKLEEALDVILGKYSKEVISLSGLNEDVIVGSLSNGDLERLHSQVLNIFSRKKNPQVVFKNKNIVDVLPFDIEPYKDYKKKPFTSFNEALDYFFSKKESEIVKKTKKKTMKKKIKKRTKKKKKK